MNNKIIEVGDFVVAFIGDCMHKGVAANISPLGPGMWVILDINLTGKHKPVYVPDKSDVHLESKNPELLNRES